MGKVEKNRKGFQPGNKYFNTHKHPWTDDLGLYLMRDRVQNISHEASKLHTHGKKDKTTGPRKESFVFFC